MKLRVLCSGLSICLFLFTLGLFSCKDDDKGLFHGKVKIGNCERYVSFEAEVISSVSPDESAGITNYAELDPAEQLMLLPVARKCKVVSCIHSDGTFEGYVELMRTSGVYEYAENVVGIGLNEKPLFHRAEFFRDGTITYYDEQGESINTGFTDPEVNALLQTMLHMQQAADTLRTAHFNEVLQALSEAGFGIDSLAGQHVITIDHPLQDGFSRLFFDTHRYAVVGQEDYDEAGNLLQGYRLFLSGGFNDFKVVGHEFRTSFQSPFTGVKMNIYRRTLITNFIMH